MPDKCAGCGKTVYFAEKIKSINKIWHKPCLRCENCKKTLTPGRHSEHNDKPYCDIPCYSALFGPKGYGHGGTESHSYNAPQQ